jgi:hypothetical protein
VQFYISVASIGQDEISVDSEIHPLAVILSQDCDLLWDYEERNKERPDAFRLLPNILFCEVQIANSLKGTNGIASDIWRRVKNNKDERYHYLTSISLEQDSIQQGFDDLAIDFKRYFTIRTDEVYAQLNMEARRRSHLLSPFCEHLSDRFAHFQQRIALPE